MPDNKHIRVKTTDAPKVASCHNLHTSKVLCYEYIGPSQMAGFRTFQGVLAFFDTNRERRHAIAATKMIPDSNSVMMTARPLTAT